MLPVNHHQDAEKKEQKSNISQKMASCLKGGFCHHTPALLNWIGEWKEGIVMVAD